MPLPHLVACADIFEQHRANVLESILVTGPAARLATCVFLALFDHARLVRTGDRSHVRATCETILRIRVEGGLRRLLGSSGRTAWTRYQRETTHRERRLVIVLDIGKARIFVELVRVGIIGNKAARILEGAECRRVRSGLADIRDRKA